MGILDRIPAPVRHALIGLAAAFISYAAANYTTWGIAPAVYPVLGALITVLGLWITPLTVQYGVGSSTAVVDEPTETPSVEAGA